MEVDSYSDIDVGVDLVAVSINHISFLQTVDKSPSLYGGPVLQEALRRYTQLWLPLAAEHPDEVLSAPLDIEWVWHCHMLAPRSYQQDCLNNFQVIINHQVLEEQAYQQALAFSENYWKQKYPNEAFSIDLSGKDLVSGQGHGVVMERANLTYDIEAAAGRQKVFYYQVSLRHYTDKKYLGKALERYKKYLFLKKKNPETFLVPCYDMDLMWHSHMNFPLIYKAVTELLLGATLNHDDSVNDRSEGSRLNRADASTRHLWKETYNEHFASYGAMYRGDPPNGKLETVPAEDMLEILTKYLELILKKVEVQGSQKDSLGKIKLNFIEKKEILLSGRYQGEKEVVDMSDKMLTLKGADLEWNSPGRITQIANCMDSNNLYVVLSQQSSFMCCSGGSETQGEGHIDLKPLAKRLTNVKDSINHDFAVDLDSDLQVAINMKVELTNLGPCDLWLVPGQYEECVMPEQNEQLWGPVPLPKLPDGVENTCSVASHKLKAFNGKVMFTCRMIHCVQLMMSAVQVFYHNKMVAVAHVIGCDQIPRPDDVAEQERVMTLDPKSGERALVIKNTYGDWGILVGRWDGYKVGVPAKRGLGAAPGRPGIRGCPGYLSVLFFKVKTRKWEIISLEDPYATEEFRFEIGDAKVDLKNGKINVKGIKNEVAEHIALTFCVSLLHVFLQPRPANWEPGETLEPPINRRGNNRVRYIKADSLPMVMAAGLLIATPSNFFIRKKILERKKHAGHGAFMAHQDSHDSRHDDHDQGESLPAAVFGNQGHSSGDHVKTEDIVTQLIGDGQDSKGDSLLDDLVGTDHGGHSGNEEEGFFGSENVDPNDYGFNVESYDDGFATTDFGTDAFVDDTMAEDFNTFLGDYDFGSGETGDNDGGGDSGWGGFSTSDGDGGGCGGCGAGCGGGGLFGGGDGGGGGDSGGGGAFGGGAFSGGAFDSGSGGGDGGGGGGWLDGLSSVDTGGGGGDGGGGWGDGGGGGGDGGGGGGDGGGGGCGGCGG